VAGGRASLFRPDRLYSDLIDVNPPLIFVLNLVPAWIASATPLGAVAALRLCMLAYGGFCWWLSLRIRDRAAEGPVERAFLDVLPALFLFDTGYDFGQREHLMTLAALPYVLAAARRAAGEVPRGCVAAGLLAGVGFALKPYFLGVPALIELCVLLARRPDGAFLPGMLVSLRRSLRDPVPWLMAGVWAVYLASLPVVFPDYLSTMMPLVWGFHRDLGSPTIRQVLLTARVGAAICLLLPVLAAAFRHRPTALSAPGAALPPLLALAALAAFAAIIAQQRGWSPHIMPIEMFACGLAGVLAARWIDRRRISIGAPAPYTVAAVLGGLFALYAVSNGEAPWRQIAYPDSPAAGLAALLEREAAGERVLVLSPVIDPVYPALNYAGAQSTLRTMSTWLLQDAYRTCLPDGRRYREVWEMGRPEFFVYRTVAEDFAPAPPAAVLVDSDAGIPVCGGAFDFVAYFRRHPLFAEVWSHYQLTATWGRFRLYTPKD
jgi:hypothetical protein